MKLSEGSPMNETNQIHNQTNQGSFTSDMVASQQILVTEQMIKDQKRIAQIQRSLAMKQGAAGADIVEVSGLTIAKNSGVNSQEHLI
mmetsp:Transcript_39369/g.60189  ORF Transcript_39369/g.60189 Transcript_39369/m.60189 type:complete len:87 (-) Transcript_39369:951-1211(-)